MKREKILLAGASGYLGQHITAQLLENNYSGRLIVRDEKKVGLNAKNIEIVHAELTQPGTLTGIFTGIDTVISSVGITKQKDGLTYMDVDYGANMNLLEQAKNSGVRKFIYVSAFNGELMKHLKIGEAKEKFVEALEQSGMEYCIIRPNGFFSDTIEFLRMAKTGSVYLFKKGECRMNPIHGEDVAKVCVDAIHTDEKVINFGGPETFTHNEMAKMAFKVIDKEPKIKYMPEWMRKFSLCLMRTFTRSKTYGPIEFFMNVLAMDMVAPQKGNQKLLSFFEQHKND